METATVNKTASSEPASLATADGNATNLVGEKENTVDFTNTYKNVPITGVIMNHMPGYRIDSGSSECYGSSVPYKTQTDALEIDTIES